MTARHANYSEHCGVVRVRVMCPCCDAGGAHDIDMRQPKCHECGRLMRPASNDKTECSWKAAQEYAKAHYSTK